ncbi:MAG: fatty acid desaturase, partial [Ketobacter sp.]
VYAHVIISTLRGNLSAWRIERERLQKKRKPLLSVHNVAIRGYLMSGVILLAAFAIASWSGVLFFTAAGLWGKALLEIVNYMEHYGMVRNPETPVAPRHSWNTNKRFSSWSMFNLTRHSHHHAQGEVPYHELKPYHDAPMMINGYLTTIAVALIPPLWHKLMTPKLLAWDAHYASAEERSMAAEANRKSGLKRLQAMTYDDAAPEPEAKDLNAA